MSCAVRRFTYLVATLLALCASERSAYAIPIVSLEYTETALGGGLFQYDYTLNNLSDPIADAGVDAWDFFLSFTATLVSAVTPPDWDVIAGPDFLEAFSLLPGPPPAGADVGPGQALSGFTFIFDAPVGSLPFQAILLNPNDPESPFATSGVTEASVPDGGMTAGLFGSALLALWAVRRRLVA